MRKLSREPLLDISWYGHSCFRLGGRGLVTVVTDPCVPVQRSGRGLKADVVCLSQGDAESPPARDGRDAPLRFGRPGEYEVGGMFLRGIALHAQQNGAMRRNVAWLFHFGELNLLHPGALGQIPEQDWFETLGEVHVLLLPLGGGGLDAETAAGLVARLEPRCVLPVCQADPADDAPQPLEGFLTAMGVSRPREEDLLRVTIGNLPEQTRVVLLRPRPAPE